MSLDVLPDSSKPGLLVLRGRIKNLKVVRDRANFFFTRSDQKAMGVVAAAAALAGQGAAAMGTTMAASDLEEEADFIEFDLDEKKVRGWVWRSPFKENEEVEVVAESTIGGYESYAISRPKDRTVALYPHCSRGVFSHVCNAAKWWLISSVVALIMIWVFFAFGHFILLSEEKQSFVGFRFLFVQIAAVFFCLFALISIHLTWRWMKFVRLAERVFTAFGWDNPSRIDLVKSSKGRKQPGDTVEYGVMYFRY